MPEEGGSGSCFDGAVARLGFAARMLALLQRGWESRIGRVAKIGVMLEIHVVELWCPSLSGESLSVCG